MKLRPQAPWLTSDLMEEKKRKRRLQRRWRRIKSIEDKEIYRNERNRYNIMLNEVHTRYLSTLVSENSRDSKALFKMINTLLNKKTGSPLSVHWSASDLVSTFNTYFIDKVTLIHQSLEELNHTQNIVVEERRYKIGRRRSQVNKKMARRRVARLNQCQLGYWFCSGLKGRRPFWLLNPPAKGS